MKKSIRAILPEYDAKALTHVLEQNKQLTTTQAYQMLQVIQWVYPQAAKVKATRKGQSAKGRLPFWNIVIGILCLAMMLLALSAMMRG